MSQRVLLFATHISPICSFFSAPALNAVEQVIKWYRENLSEPTPAALAMASGTAGEILSQHRRIDQEDGDKIQIVFAVARMLGVENPENAMMGAEWKRDAWLEYHEMLRDYSCDETLHLLEYFTEGRPILGKSFGRGGSYYGYLEGSEAGDLLRAIQAIELEYPIISESQCGDVFHNYVVEWLDEAVFRKRDIWIHSE